MCFWWFGYKTNENRMILWSIWAKIINKINKKKKTQEDGGSVFLFVLIFLIILAQIGGKIIRFSFVL